MLRYKALRYKVLLPLAVLLLGACGSAPTFEIDELSPNPVLLNLNGGTVGSSSVTLKLTPKNGFRSVLSLSLVKDNGDPAPGEIGLIPTSVNLSGNNQATYTLTIVANYSNPPTAPQNYNLNLKITGGNVTKEKSFTLTINP